MDEERIKKLLAAKLSEKQQANATLEGAQEHQQQQKTPQEAAAKWNEDARLIARFLNELQERLKDADARFLSADMGGKPGVGIAHMEIQAKIAGKSFSLQFAVTGDGTVMTTYSKAGGPMSVHAEGDPYFPPFNVFDATRATYESIILTALEST